MWILYLPLFLQEFKQSMIVSHLLLSPSSRERMGPVPGTSIWVIEWFQNHPDRVYYNILAFPESQVVQVSVRKTFCFTTVWILNLLHTFFVPRSRFRYHTISVSPSSRGLFLKPRSPCPKRDPNYFIDTNIRYKRDAFTFTFLTPGIILCKHVENHVLIEKPNIDQLTILHLQIQPQIISLKPIFQRNKYSQS